MQPRSLGGFRYGRGLGRLRSTKFAVEGPEGAAAELGPLGVKTTIVEPGFPDHLEKAQFDGSSLHTADTTIDDYAATTGTGPRS